MEMELISNLFQFAVTLLGFCLSGIWYLKDRKQIYFLLTCFYGCFALGSLYWTLYLLLFSETPQVFYVSEFGWIASVIFLYLLQYTLSSAEERDFSRSRFWTRILRLTAASAIYPVSQAIAPCSMSTTASRR